MKKFLIGVSFLIVGAAGWRIGAHLSSDAIAMAVGVFFGVLAGIPIALLVAAANAARPQANESVLRAKLRAEIEAELCAAVSPYRLAVKPTVWRVVANERQISGS